jgi:hypothetical protein
MWQAELCYVMSEATVRVLNLTRYFFHTPHSQATGQSKNTAGTTVCQTEPLRLEPSVTQDWLFWSQFSTLMYSSLILSGAVCISFAYEAHIDVSLCVRRRWMFLLKLIVRPRSFCGFFRRLRVYIPAWKICTLIQWPEVRSWLKIILL